MYDDPRPGGWPWRIGFPSPPRRLERSAVTSSPFGDFFPAHDDLPEMVFIGCRFQSSFLISCINLNEMPRCRRGGAGRVLAPFPSRCRSKPSGRWRAPWVLGSTAGQRSTRRRRNPPPVPLDAAKPNELGASRQKVGAIGSMESRRGSTHRPAEAIPPAPAAPAGFGRGAERAHLAELPKKMAPAMAGEAGRIRADRNARPTASRARRPSDFRSRALH